MSTQYLVLNEHTLGYTCVAQPYLLGVLASKPQLGGYNPKNGPVCIGALDQTRLATQADFDYFRVCSAGHI